MVKNFLTAPALQVPEELQQAAIDSPRLPVVKKSDVLLSKGVVNCLWKGFGVGRWRRTFEGAPDFMYMLGLKQSLTPSRSNGFLNMLKLVQKGTLQVYSNSSSMSMTTGNVATAASNNPKDERSGAGVGEGEPTHTKKHLIEKKLTEGLTPVELEVEDVSYQHAGHAGAPKGSSETHFNVKVVSDQFQGRSLLKRHRLVYDLLHDELQHGGVHALSLNTKTPAEVAPKS